MNTQKTHAATTAMRALAGALLPMFLAAFLHAQNVVTIPNGLTTLTSDATYDGIASGAAQQLVVASGGAATSGFLLADGVTLTVSNNDNSAAANGAGAIYAPSGAPLTITQQTAGGSGAAVFSNNTGLNGGAINASDSLTIGDNALFASNTASGAGSTGATGGGAIVNFGTNTIISVGASASFTGNFSAAYGGAIASFNTVSVGPNATFTDNRAAGDGGAIDAPTVIIGDNSLFASNTAGNANSGGAIIALSATIGDNALFTDNHCRNEGGAICTIDTGGCISMGSSATFSGNYTGDGGGAVYSSGALNIGTDANFTNNKGFAGGAIYAQGVAIIGANALFVSNTAAGAAGNGGGAIWVSGDTAVVSVGDGATFAGNISANQGGAIQVANAAGLFSTGANATFTGNTSASAGGAIYSSGSIIIGANALFASNTATAGTGGGAINNYQGHLALTDATFTNNTATANGGAIANRGASTTINVSAGATSAFIGNTAAGVPNAIFNAAAAVNSTLAINIAAGGLLDMADPVTGTASMTITITSAGAGLWKLGGANTFTGGATNFAVTTGTLRLYGAGELASDGMTRATTGNITISGAASTFTLGSGVAGAGNLATGNPATLELGGSNAIAAPIISLSPNSVITFASDAAATDLLTLTGAITFDTTTLNIRTAANNASDTIAVTGHVAFAGAGTLNLRSWNAGAFTLLTSDNALPANATTAFTVVYNGIAQPAATLSLGASGKSLVLTLPAVPNATPVISLSPIGKTITAGDTATFTIAANGNPAPTFQWQTTPAGSTTWTNITDTAPYSGATTATLTITAATTALNGNQYRCVATNTATPAGATTTTTSATSAAATLTVNAAPPPPPPVDTNPPIVTSPASADGKLGAAFSYQIAASHNPATYAATGLPPGLTLNSATGLITGAPTTAGVYTVAITTTNQYGTGRAEVTFLIAGDDPPAYTPTLLPDTSAPTIMLYDAAGNIYVSDPAFGAIMRITKAGVIAHDFVTGLNQPSGLAIDSAGANLFIADTGNGAIKRAPLPAGGATTTIATGLAQPTGLAIAANGLIFVSCAGDNTIYMLTPTAAGTGAAAVYSSQFTVPSVEPVASLETQAADDTPSDSNVMGASISLTSEQDAPATLTDAEPTTDAPTPAGAEAPTVNRKPKTVNFDAAASAAAASATGYTIQPLAGGATSGSADGIGAAAQFNIPTGLAYNDATNTLYVADTGNSTLRAISLDTRRVTTVVGAAGQTSLTDGAGPAARLNTPEALAIDKAGIVYIADTGNNLVRVYDPVTQKVTSVVPAATATAATPDAPAGIAVNTFGDGSVSVVDTTNAAILTLQAKPTILTVPADRAAKEGQTVTIDATAWASPAPEYKWYKNSVIIPTATTAIYELAPAKPADTGAYTVTAGNAAGVDTATFTLTITATTTTGGNTGGNTGGGNTGGGGGGGGGGAPSLFYFAAAAALLAVRSAKLRR